MKIDKKTGLLRALPFYPSPHCDARPSQIIDLIVIHGISLPPGEFGKNYIDAFFLGKLNFDLHPYFKMIAQLKVAPHILIKRNGDLIQYVPFNKRAWHAGVSQFKGRENCNDFSIGIELEGTDDLPYEEQQYDQLVCIVKLLQNTYLIPQDHVVGHDAIAPGRKTDPGPAFDWDYFFKILR